MIDIKGAIDAPEDYWITLGNPSTSKACRHLELRHPENCFGARLIRYEDPNVEDVRVWLTITLIKFKDQPVPWKYDNSADMRRLATINDKKGRRGMIQALRIIELFDASKVKLLKPRKTTSYAWMRSDEFRKYRKVSKAKRRKEIAAGSPKRKFTHPTSIGLRSGMGKAHTWEE